MSTDRNRRVLFLAICALGISAFITQLTLMRELLSVFAGNELIFGVVLGSWLLLTGIGSFLGKTAPRLRHPIGLLVVTQVLVALLPIADVFLLRVFRQVGLIRVVFRALVGVELVRGAAVGPTQTVLICLVLLAPYCLVAGFLLTLASLILARRKEPASIGQVYFLDNVGDMAGGLLFTFILVFFFNHFQILYFPALLNLLFAGLVAIVFGRRILLALVAVVTAALVGVIVTYNLNDESAAIQYAGQRVVYQGQSPYGSLVVTELSGQYNFIHNGVVLFSTQNVEAAEETVHYAMAQRPDARRVLLISGGVSGTAKEILKYPVEAVDYVELDPLIIQVARQYLPEVRRSLADPRIQVVNRDGRLFVRETQRRYDVVIVDVPDPSTSQLNRFYTREFFAEVSRRLAPDGVLSISAGEYANFLGPQLADLVAVTHRTLAEQFGEVRMIPAERTGRIFFLASDGPVTTQPDEIADRMEAKGISTQLVSRRYLRGALAPSRLADLSRAVSAEAPVNRDFSPILYYYHLLYWISQFQVSFGLLQGGLLVILVVCLIRFRPVSFAIFTTGLAASALEVVLLVGFQILYGFVYHQVGLIVAMFMVGLGIGSFTMNRMLPRRSRRDLVKLEFGVALYAACLPLVLMGMSRLESATMAAMASHVGIPLLALFLAMMVGLEFPLAGKADFRTVSDTAARLYTADYLGAALGALLVSTFLIPVLGVVAVCLLAAGLNLASGVVVLCTSRRG